MSGLRPTFSYFTLPHLACIPSHPRTHATLDGAGIIYDYSLGSLGMLTARASFAHRDRFAFNDSNTTFGPETDMVNASLAWQVNDELTISLYGKNLKDEVRIGGSAQLPFFPGATFSPIGGKGKIYGAEIQYSY